MLHDACIQPTIVFLTFFCNITDAACEEANRAWKQFIKLNYLAGFLVTMILILANLNL